MNLMLNGIEAMKSGAGELTMWLERSQNGLLLVSVRTRVCAFPTKNLIYS